jgi:glycerophosphoryl diester phosphodiesterase
MDTREEIHMKVLVAGHRGYSQLAPENTMAAFRLCFERGIPGIELDVQSTADGDFVIIHDQNLARTTNGSGNVREKTLLELKSLDAGSWKDPKFAGERIPSLDEALDYMKGRFTRIYMELKTVTDHRTIYEMVKEKGMLDTVLFHSFLVNADRLSEIRDWDDEAYISVLTGGKNFQEALDRAKAIKANEMCLSWGWLKSNPQVMPLMRSAGLFISVWGPKTLEQVDEAMALGLDGLIMDDPGIVPKSKVKASIS